MRSVRALAAVAVLALAGCSSSATGPTTASASGADLSGSITVLAAASLTETFTALGTQFEAGHPGTTVTFSFGASSALSAQVLAGAPADVFAAANTATMDAVVAGGAAADPQTFATNTLELVVPAGNPGGVTGLADLARPQLRIALCAESVPCGSAARTLLTRAGVTAQPDTLEDDVKATLAKVRLGEVDAALVYRTDVTAAGDEVEGIEVPPASTVVNSYPLVVLEEAADPAVARAFVDLVLSDAGRQVLEKAGFGAP